MGTLAFFPWLRLAPQSIQIGEFELIPYVRHRYDGPDAAAIDVILSSYRESPDTPIAEATLLLCDSGGELLTDLDDEQVAAAFTFGEMVALAGLAGRRFFSHSGYSNRDNYRLVIQRFDDPGNGVVLRDRRRDGNKSTLVMPAVHRVACPRHVDLERVDLDLALLRALSACRSQAGATDFVDSMVTFNLANTDSSAMSPHVELVLSSGALERVLGCRNGNHEELAAGLTLAIAPRTSVARVDCPRVSSSKKFSKSTTIREVWIRDLFVLRGDLAHGKVGPEYPSIWSVAEHLLLTSFVFPLTMKVQLAKAGVYTMTDDDQLAIDTIEKLACADLFTPIDELRVRWPWTEIARLVADDERRRRTVEALEQMDARGVLSDDAT